MAARELFDTPLYYDANLVSYYRCENTADSKGANTLTNNGTATFVGGQFSNGVNVNGSNQYFSKAGSYGIAFNTSYSYGGWVKLNAEIASGIWVLFALNTAAGGADVTQLRYEYNAGTRKITIVRYNSGANDTEPSYNITLGTSTYTHLFYTYDSATARMDLYVNGVSVVNATGSNTLGTTGAYTQGFYIGGDQGGATATNAIIDDVTVFSRALTPAEIQKLYTGNFSKELYLTPLIADPSLVSYYRFEGNSNDSKGSKNGTDTAITYNTASGFFGQGASFNGSTSNIQTTNALTGLGAFSIAAWFRLGALNAYQGIVIQTNNINKNCQFRVTNTNKLELDLVTAGSADTLIDGSTTLTTNTWYHGVCTYDGANMRLYLNGSSDATAVGKTGTVDTGSNTTLAFGAYTTGGIQIPLNGVLDEVAVFSRALSSVEISNIYNGTWPSNLPLLGVG